jgi:hypothetical protein
MLKATLPACLCALALATPALGAGVTPTVPFEQTRIPHLDGSGRATIVEIEPTMPGAKAFLSGEPPAIPQPGDIIVPPRSTPEPSPAPGGSD